MSEQRQIIESAQGYSKSRLIGLFLGAGFLLLTVFVPPSESMAVEAWSGEYFPGDLSLRAPDYLSFLGGFTLGLAMQRWNFHRRIAR